MVKKTLEIIGRQSMNQIAKANTLHLNNMTTLTISHNKDNQKIKLLQMNVQELETDQSK